MLQDLLKDLQEREVDRLESKQLELTEKRYPGLPNEIKRVSDLTGLPEETIVHACVGAAWHYKDLEWHSVLDIVKSFYLAKRNYEAKQGEEA